MPELGSRLYLCGVSVIRVFKNKVDTYNGGGGTVDKPMASLFTCHLGLCLGWQSC